MRYVFYLKIPKDTRAPEPVREVVPEAKRRGVFSFGKTLNSKHQFPRTKQAPMPKFQRPMKGVVSNLLASIRLDVSDFVFEICLDVGSCDLDLGSIIKFFYPKIKGRCLFADK